MSVCVKQSHLYHINGHKWLHPCGSTWAGHAVGGSGPTELDWQCHSLCAHTQSWCKCNDAPLTANHFLLRQPCLCGCIIHRLTGWRPATSSVRAGRGGVKRKARAVVWLTEETGGQLGPYDSFVWNKSGQSHAHSLCWPPVGLIWAVWSGCGGEVNLQDPAPFGWQSGSLSEVVLFLIQWDLASCLINPRQDDRIVHWRVL